MRCITGHHPANLLTLNTLHHPLSKEQSTNGTWVLSNQSRVILRKAIFDDIQSIDTSSALYLSTIRRLIELEESFVVNK